jgi:hypothetical protein
MRRWLMIGVVLWSAAAPPACESTKVCPTIGCLDGFTATVQRADGSFPSGVHRIEALVDGVTLKCTFTFPFATTTTQATCDAGLNVMVLPAQICLDTHNGQSSGVSCSPIAGQFSETVTLAGTPGQVHVWQTVDDAAILDAAVAPQYADVRPGGPDCEAICRQASATWTLE